MRQFLILAKENKTLRLEMEAGLAAAAQNFALARAGMPEPVLDTGLLIPGQEVTLETGEQNVMGVITPRFSFKTRSPDGSSIYSYGLAFTAGDLDMAVKSLANVLPVMLRLAEVEKTCQLMAAEIEKTRRRVNALEYMVIPELQETIKYITMKLDENERSNQIRLMKVKDMMLEEAHHYEERADVGR
jgi:V/A-type H+-transporting ATPase subunit D